MDSKELFSEFENRVESKELTKTESGGVDVLGYINTSQKIKNVSCRRTIHTNFDKNKVDIGV